MALMCSAITSAATSGRCGRIRRANAWSNASASSPEFRLSASILRTAMSWFAAPRRRHSAAGYSATTPGTPLPPTLAGTGTVSDLATLTPNAGIVPYDINLPFWSDGAQKSRWFSIPDTTGMFTFNARRLATPTGTVWIKHFELQMTNGDAASARRLETRFSCETAVGFTA